MICSVLGRIGSSKDVSAASSMDYGEMEKCIAGRPTVDKPVQKRCDTPPSHPAPPQPVTDQS